MMLFVALYLTKVTGATGLCVGYLDEDVPVEQARWYAYAQYRGARVAEEDHWGRSRR